MSKIVLILFILLGSVSAISQELPKGAIQLQPGDIKWGDAPPNLPPGSKLAVLESSPRNEGIFTIRVQFPPYYKIPAHTHPKEERVTVISGVVNVGFGNVTDTTSATQFTQGCYYVNPPGASHYVFTVSEGCILQITGLGPWGLDYTEEKK